MRAPARPLVIALAVLALPLGVLTPIAATASPAAGADSIEAAPGGTIPLLAGPFAGDRFVPPLVPPSEVGAASASITVTYTSFTPQAQAAFQAAVDLWEQLINSSVPIHINAVFEPLGSGILGSAGPSSIFKSDDPSCLPQTSTWYAVALANAVCGFDLAPGQPDGDASFSSSFANWYFGTDGQPGGNQYDFETVVMHELGHVLGFLGSMSVTGSQGSWGFQDSGFTPPFFPAIYDRFTEDSVQPLLSYPNNSSSLRAALISNAVQFNGTNTNAANGGSPAKLYAPTTWSSGSSFSHLDETTFDNTPNALMTPQLGLGEGILSPGPVTLGILADMGWTIPTAPGAPENVVATAGSGQASVAFDPPATDGGSAITKYTVTADPGGAVGEATGSPVNVAGLDDGTPYTFTVTATNAFGTGPPGGPSSPAVTPALHGYFPVDPTRILDTRFGVAGANPDNTPLGPGATSTIQVADYIPGTPTGVTAVVMNVTATRPTRNGWLTVWDDGPAPTASNLNFVAGQTVPNLVTVKVKGDGTVQLGNTVGCTCTPGTTDAIFDVVGYFLGDGTGAEVSSLPPTRILDTRFGVPGNDPRSTPLAPQEAYDVQVGGLGGVPTDAMAVIMNVTATGPTKPGWLTLYPTGVGSPPTVSNLNFVAGETVPNLVTVKLSPTGKVTVANTDGNPAAGSTNVIFDVVGYYGGTGANGGGLNATTPVRILDTRQGVPGANARSTPLAPQEATTVQIAGYGGVPITGATAVVMNVTATGATKPGWLTLWPAPGPPPTASNLNFVAGQTVPNLVVIALGPGGTIQLGNTNNNPAAGSTNVIFDVVGWYA